MSEMTKNTEKAVDYKLQECEGESRDHELSAEITRMRKNQNARQWTDKMFRKAKRCSKMAHLLSLAEKYHPLLEDDEETEKGKEEKRNKKSERCKKNACIAAQFNWEFILAGVMAGLQNFTAGYYIDASALAYAFSSHGTSNKSQWG